MEGGGVEGGGGRVVSLPALDLTFPLPASQCSGGLGESSGGSGWGGERRGGMSGERVVPPCP